jgi:hypothetical protein
LLRLHAGSYRYKDIDGLVANRKNQIRTPLPFSFLSPLTLFPPPVILAYRRLFSIIFRIVPYTRQRFNFVSFFYEAIRIVDCLSYSCYHVWLRDNKHYRAKPPSRLEQKGDEDGTQACTAACWDINGKHCCNWHYPGERLLQRRTVFAYDSACCVLGSYHSLFSVVHTYVILRFIRTQLSLSL